MAQITVNARTYELVTVPDLTLDEAIVLWDYTKLGLDQIADIEGFHPGLIKALIHISVARGEPEETARTIGRTVGQIKWVELNTVFTEISEDVDEVPPSRARLEQQRFWRGFLIHWGAAPGTCRPERYWSPWLGHWTHLRPEDLGAMTPYQLEACYGWVTKAQG